MGIKQAIDIDSKQKKELLTLFNTYLPNTKIWAYGSRVKWSEKPSSDLDLVAFSKSAQASAVSKLKDALVESDLPFKVDLLIWDNIPNSFQVNIKENYFELQSDKQEDLPSGWRVVRLGDLALIKGGKRLPKGHMLQVGITKHPYIRVRDIKERSIDLDKLEYMSDNTFKKISRYIVNTNDLLISTVGTIGLVSIINEVLDGASQTENCAKLSNLDKHDGLFLYYFLTSSIGQQRIYVSTVGAVQAKLPLYALENLQINWTTKENRKAIAHILGKLDDKIELNRQINQTLETMAQTLFKSWFVNFDPVIDNAIKAGNPIPDPLKPQAQKRKTTKSTLPKTIQDLFPNSFVFNDKLKKWIPEGWAVEKLKNSIKITKGKSYRSDELKKSKTALVTLKSFKRGGGYRLDGLKEYIGGYKNEQEVFQGDLIIAYTDVTQAADVIGKPALITGNKKYNHLVASLDVGIVRSNKETMKYFIYGLAKTRSFQMHNYSYSTGTTVLHLGKNAINDYFFSNPKEVLFKKYSELVKSNFELINYRTEEAETLTKLRDTLLPKLISGKIRVSYQE